MIKQAIIFSKYEPQIFCFHEGSSADANREEPFLQAKHGTHPQDDVLSMQF